MKRLDLRVGSLLQVGSSYTGHACRGAWESPDDAMRREVGEELPCLPLSAIDSLERELRASPAGAAQRYLDLSLVRRPRRPQRVHYWQFRTGEADGSPSAWVRGGELEREWKPIAVDRLLGYAYGSAAPCSPGCAMLRQRHGCVHGRSSPVPSSAMLGDGLALLGSPQGYPSGLGCATSVCRCGYALDMPQPQARGRVVLVLCSEQHDGVVVLCRKGTDGGVQLPEAPASSVAEVSPVAANANRML